MNKNTMTCDKKIMTCDKKIMACDKKIMNSPNKTTIFNNGVIRLSSFAWSMLAVVCSAVSMNVVQAEPSLSQETMDHLTSEERLNYDDLERLTETLNSRSRTPRSAPCVYVHHEFPIYSLAPNDFTVVSRYNTRCSRGTHSISVNTRVSGRGWLVAYVFKQENNQWVEVSGGTASASFYGVGGEYQLVAFNRDANEAATGHAKISYPLF